MIIINIDEYYKIQPFPTVEFSKVGDVCTAYKDDLFRSNPTGNIHKLGSTTRRFLILLFSICVVVFQDSDWLFLKMPGLSLIT